MVGSSVASASASRADMPWVEKYRPKTLDDLVAHEEIISTIERLVDNDRLPHLLLYGPPGTGKTSTILACARKMYGNNTKGMILELNASDNRGINDVRDLVQNFASTRKLFSSGIKLIILDEADSMTKAAQFALRRIIEKYTKNARFCLICNYVSKIIPALQSRCTRFRFSPLKDVQVRSRVEGIVRAEGLDVTPAGLNALLKLGRGDMRKILNIMQSAAMSYSTITDTSVYACTGMPTEGDIKACMNALLTGTFGDGCETIRSMQLEKGLALGDILTEVFKAVSKIDLPPRSRMYLLKQLADSEYRLAFATHEKLQLSGLVGTFHKLRALMQEEGAPPPKPANAMDLTA